MNLSDVKVSPVGNRWWSDYWKEMARTRISRAANSGERRLPACGVRQPAERTSVRRVRGKLPRTAGWQPALPRMNRELVDKIVNAVLYEGYILYPYRASSKKNQRERFTFGRVYPEAYSVAQEGREPCAMQTQCLIRDESKDAVAHVEVRFLHPMAREIGDVAGAG